MQTANGTTTVYISNVSEDVWPFINEMGPVAKKAEIEENATLFSDRDLFSFIKYDNIAFILPHPVSPAFLEYYQRLFSSKRIQIISPKQHSGQICLDILGDSSIMNLLKQLATSEKILTLIAYSSSPQFLQLLEELRCRGFTVNVPESPDSASAWTVNFYGSKSGIRQLSQLSGATEPDLKMAEGMISYGLVDTSRVAAQMYVKNGGVVLKTNKGHSGAGVLIIPPGKLAKDFVFCQKHILNELKKEKYWEKFPIIVEKYIQPAITIGGGFPNAEYKIHKNGRVEFLFYCSMRVTKEGVFKGIEIHNDVLSDQVSAQVVDTGFYVGERYSEKGYRGYYDIDFVAAKNGELYVTETNVRRTGGTHLYHTATALFGKDFMYLTYCLCNNLYQFTRSDVHRFSDLLSHLKRISFNHKSKEGLLITSANLLSERKFGYIIFGKTKRRALEIEMEMERLLNSTAASR